MKKLKVKISREDIVKCYRVGEISRNKTRPIIIKFERYSTKFKILKNCGNLKGTKIGVPEDLIKSRLELLFAAQQRIDKKCVFTRYGNIFIKTNNKTQKLKTVEQLEEICRTLA